MFAGTSSLNDTKAGKVVELKIEARMSNCGAAGKAEEVYCNVMYFFEVGARLPCIYTIRKSAFIK